MRGRIRPRSDRGLTLVELIVYVVLLGLVMTVIFGVFTSINTAQNTVTSVVGASNQGQATATQLSKAITNASSAYVYSPTSGDLILLTRTAQPGTTATWVCEAWYYQSAANAASGVGTIRFTTSTAAIPAPTAAALSTWTVLASGVSPVNGGNVFISPYFTNGTMIVSFEFYITGAGQKPQLISSSATSPLGTGGGSPCF